MKKSSKRYTYYTFTLIIFFIGILFLPMRNLFFFPLKNKPQNIDTIYFKSNDNKFHIEYLLDSKKLYSQRLITTQPNLSFFYKLINKSPLFKFIDNTFFFEKKNIVLNNSLGGIILYDYNMSQANKYGGLENYIKILTNLYSQKIILLDTIKNLKFTINIKPFIVTDFDYPLKNKKINYSRLTNILNVDQYSTEKVLQNYSKVNINSFLGPNVDFSEIDNNYKIKIDTLLLWSNKYNLIPCLKHFCYDPKNGNTHNTNALNLKPLPKILKEDLLPYNFISSKSTKPYLIMVGHHKIYSIDSTKIASQSKNVINFIDSSYKNSITISDEIMMKASSNSKSYFPDFNFIRNIKTDIILSHGGNIVDHRYAILEKIKKFDKQDVQKKYLKILKLKFAYNLIDINPN